MNTPKLLFPKKFAWGVSTSSYQNEDPFLKPADPNFFETDWDIFYKAGFLKFPKGNGTLSFSSFEKDIEALKLLGVTHYRFGVEWARVEPKPGVFNEEAIEHYVQMAKRLQKENIIPFVALWHFTFPSWLTNLNHKNQHGWLHPLAFNHWKKYVEKIVQNLSPHVNYYGPQNEPNTQALMGYLIKIWPPGDSLNFFRYQQNLKESAKFFLKAVEIIKNVQSEAKIFTIQNMVHWHPSRLDPFRILFRWGRDFNFSHLDQVAKATDIIGFTYYMGESASPLVPLIHALEKRNGHRVSDLGWPIDPEGLKNLSLQLTKRYQKPLMILENGIADQGDKKRQKYLMDHLKMIHEAIAKGADIRGYFHWSLIDNYEWSFGYGPKFGLFHFNGSKNELKPKPSAHLFRDWIKNSQ